MDRYGEKVVRDSLYESNISVMLLEHAVPPGSGESRLGEGPALGKMNSLWLLRMARWVRHPPSAARVWMFVFILALALIIAAAQYFGYWPAWATLPVHRRLPRL